MKFYLQQIVNRVARGGWTIDCETVDEAEKYLIDNPDELTAYAVAELLNRLKHVGKALGATPDYLRDSIPEPDIAMLGAEIEIGQKLYAVGDDFEINEYVVIAKDEDNRLLIIRCNDFDLRFPPKPEVACETRGFVTDPRVVMQQLIQDAQGDVDALLSCIAEAKAKLEEGKSLRGYMG